MEWLVNGLLVQALSVFGMVALGAWAARRRLLDDPGRHRRALTWAAVVGIVGGTALSAPFALQAAGFASDAPGLGRALAASAHLLGGTAAGVGYAAVFGLVAIRARPGALVRALAAGGRWSLSGYLAQSVVFVAVLPAWTVGLGATASVGQVSLLAAATWAVLLGAAVVAGRRGRRGPAETLLRRLTYGRGFPEPAPPGRAGG